MTSNDKKENSDFLENSVTYLQNLGYQNIKADIDGYETPKSYHKKGSDITVTPDIVAEKEGRKHIFDISLKTRNPEWGIRDIEDVTTIANNLGFHLESRCEMPANNLTLIFRKN